TDAVERVGDDRVARARGGIEAVPARCRRRLMAKIDSVYDLSDKALVEVKSWLEPWFLDRDGAGGGCCPPETVHIPFPTAVAALGPIGYWRPGRRGPPVPPPPGP